MKNEQLLKAIENASASFVEAVKAMTQLSNAVLSLKKKHDVKEKTAPKFANGNVTENYKVKVDFSESLNADKLFPDYVCVKDVDIYDDIQCGNVFNFFEGIGYKNICYPSDTIILPEFFTVDHKDHFKVYDPKKEVEAEKLNKQCEELIEKFMPLVSKWKFEGNTIINEAEHYNGVWSYSDNNKRKAAIRCAILHCELCNHDSSAKLILQLQKMLSE